MYLDILVRNVVVWLLLVCLFLKEGGIVDICGILYCLVKHNIVADLCILVYCDKKVVW